jgi:DNA-binding winged helix-turn-helix (wHTH) protein
MAKEQIERLTELAEKRAALSNTLSQNEKLKTNVDAELGHGGFTIVPPKKRAQPHMSLDQLTANAHYNLRNTPEKVAEKKAKLKTTIDDDSRRRQSELEEVDRVLEAFAPVYVGILNSLTDQVTEQAERFVLGELPEDELLITKATFDDLASLPDRLPPLKKGLEKIESQSKISDIESVPPGILVDDLEYPNFPIAQTDADKLETEQSLPKLKVEKGKTVAITDETSGASFTVRASSNQYVVLERLLASPNELVDHFELARLLDRPGRRQGDLESTIAALKRKFRDILPEVEMISRGIREIVNGYPYRGHKINAQIEFVDPAVRQDTPADPTPPADTTRVSPPERGSSLRPARFPTPWLDTYHWGDDPDLDIEAGKTKGSRKSGTQKATEVKPFTPKTEDVFEFPDGTQIKGRKAQLATILTEMLSHPMVYMTADDLTIELYGDADRKNKQSMTSILAQLKKLFLENMAIEIQSTFDPRNQNQEVRYWAKRAGDQTPEALVATVHVLPTPKALLLPEKPVETGPEAETGTSFEEKGLNVDNPSLEQADVTEIASDGTPTNADSVLESGPPASDTATEADGVTQPEIEEEAEEFESAGEIIVFHQDEEEPVVELKEIEKQFTGIRKKISGVIDLVLGHPELNKGLRRRDFSKYFIGLRQKDIRRAIDQGYIDEEVAIIENGRRIKSDRLSPEAIATLACLKELPQGLPRHLKLEVKELVSEEFERRSMELLAEEIEVTPDEQHESLVEESGGEVDRVWIEHYKEAIKSFIQEELGGLDPDGVHPRVAQRRFPFMKQSFIRNAFERNVLPKNSLKSRGGGVLLTHEALIRLYFHKIATEGGMSRPEKLGLERAIREVRKENEREASKRAARGDEDKFVEG